MNTNTKILVVDDEPDVLTFISTVLNDAGYHTTLAHDGEEAMTELQASRPDLITLDITMPNKSGVRFYRDVKESDDYKDIPVVIITGITGDFQRFISTRRQVPPPDGYIEKPLEADALLDVVRNLTGGSN